MGTSFLNSCLHRIGRAMAHQWIWTHWLEEQKIPSWVELHIYNKDIELQPFEGKKVRILITVEDLDDNDKSASD